MPKLQIDEEGFGFLLVDLLMAKIKTPEEKLYWQADIATALHNDNRSGDMRQSAVSISENRRQKLQAVFLRNLHYDGMEDREERIAKAHQATFQWIFETDRMNDKKWSNFKDWLESDSRLYWMTGKAGFGKSTLMKFISQRFPDSPGEEPRCWKHLKHWAGDDHLVIATFFFWNSGFPIQMTQSGLFRSLLNQILNLPSDTKLCLFVDSLDGFDGDHKALIRLFRDVTI